MPQVHSFNFIDGLAFSTCLLVKSLEQSTGEIVFGSGVRNIKGRVGTYNVILFWHFTAKVIGNSQR